MTINLGKRNLGAGTAASPGDTLYIPLAFFNDSGASISIGSSLAVGDIEVFKNGSVTQRATDSGYAILGDTGNFDNRIGFKGISISLFNTADDSTFYANGATYWVAIDSVTVDGRTVRFWPAIFEIGEPRANVVQIDGDTGSADVLAKATNGEGGVSFSAGINMNSSSDTGLNQRLSQIQSDVDTGLRTHISDVDTGLHDTIADLDTGLRGILVTTGVNLGLIRGDTGGADRFYRYTQKLDTGGDATVSASVDTGQVNQAVWQTNAQRKLTVDTGIADQVWKTTTAGYNDDTGTFGELLRNPATATVDTGQVNQAVWQGNATRVLTANTNLANLSVNVTQLDSDTGFADRLGKFASVLSDAGQIDTGTGAADTGDLANVVWNGTRAAHTTAGTFGEYVNADIDLIRGDTGGADRFYRYTQKLDTGGDATVSASVDTGQVNQAVWQANAQRKLTVDTGIADQVWMQLKASYTTDTGTFGEHLGGSLGGSATVDTGQINQAVWQANAARSITASSDTGVNQRLSQIQSDVDTGLRVHIDDLDTGLHAHISDVDTGIHSILQTVGVLVSAFSDTGVNNRLSVIAADTDTGIQSSVNVTSLADTGVNERLTAIETQTAKLTFDTGNEILADIRKVNNVTVQGTGDTGTADTWRPV